MDDNYLNVRNPDREFRLKILRQIKANGGYCPSQPKSEATKCQCKEFREHGNCICGMFLKVPCYEVTGG